MTDPAPTPISGVASRPTSGPASGIAPAINSAAKPGTKPGSKPGPTTAAKPGSSTAAKPGAKSANAAIFYASDGYRPGDKGINGRRVAGESFLKGFLKHGVVDEFVILAKSNPEAAEVETLLKSIRPDKKLRAVGLIRPQSIAPVEVMYYPAANIAPEAWRRADHGSGAWAICGLTHTTSTPGIMQGFFDLRMAPVMEWDAVICTSRAVQTAVLTQMDLIDNHIRHRFGTEPPARPMFPVIPLGIHTEDFPRNEPARASLRARLNAGPADVVFATIARLSPHEKFDPIPIFISMQAAAKDLAPGIKLHVVMCGIFRQPYAKKVFAEGAAKIMPDVGFLLLDGAKAEDRTATLSAADVFLFLIDNIQESFGLAPLEGMAAGLPVLASDWDGLKDTITADVGFRVKSRMLGPQQPLGQAQPIARQVGRHRRQHGWSCGHHFVALLVVFAAEQYERHRGLEMSFDGGARQCAAQRQIARMDRQLEIPSPGFEEEEEVGTARHGGRMLIDR